VCGCHPALGAQLLPYGNLLRPGVLPKNQQPIAVSGGGERIQEYTWDGELVWDFRLSDDRRFPHHDVLKLPNGNVLAIVCDRHTVAEAVALGRAPNTLGGDLLADGLVEIRPTGKTTGEIVWEWYVWDHLVQNTDPKKPGYRNLAAHPELIDINYGATTGPVLRAESGEFDRLRSLGYIGGNVSAGKVDFTHLNSIAYSSELDQIMMTSLNFGEFWIIDRGTTRAEAAGHTGGTRGKGGGLLYRYGNPRSHLTTPTVDSMLVAPHNAHWIPHGLPGAGEVLAYNNRVMVPGRAFSSVEQIGLPVSDFGSYRMATGNLEPNPPTWSHMNADAALSSPSFSGAQRLTNGNTLVCARLSGTVAEVTPTGEIVWRYACPPPQFPPGAPLPPANSFGVSLFRAPRFAPDFPAFKNRSLTPLR